MSNSELTSVSGNGVDDEKKEAPIDQSALAGCVRDARVMIAYLAQSNLDAKPDQFSHLIESYRIPLSDWDADREKKFWAELHTLAKAIHPASAETIEVNSHLADDWENQEDDRRQRRRKVIRHFSLVGLFTVVLVLLVQIYWIIGSNVVARTMDSRAEQTEIEKKGKALEDQISRLNERIMRQTGKSTNLDTDIDVALMKSELERLTGFDKQELNAHKDSIDERVSALYATMRLTTLGIPHLFAAEGSEVQVYLEFQKILNAAAVQYFLPLLLGLLGACVYVLREIFQKIQEKTFLPDFAVGFRLRLYLGMISGLTFAWLFSWVAPTSDGAGAGAASPLAIAFLVGYSVELLFSSLDRAIGSVSKFKSTAQNEKTSS